MIRRILQGNKFFPLLKFQIKFNSIRLGFTEAEEDTDKFNPISDEISRKFVSIGISIPSKIELFYKLEKKLSISQKIQFLRFLSDMNLRRLSNLGETQQMLIKDLASDALNSISVLTIHEIIIVLGSISKCLKILNLANNKELYLVEEKIFSQLKTISIENLVKIVRLYSKIDCFPSKLIEYINSNFQLLEDFKLYLSLLKSYIQFKKCDIKYIESLIQFINLSAKQYDFPMSCTLIARLSDLKSSIHFKDLKDKSILGSLLQKILLNIIQLYPKYFEKYILNPNIEEEKSRKIIEQKKLSEAANILKESNKKIEKIEDIEQMAKEMLSFEDENKYLNKPIDYNYFTELSPSEKYIEFTNPFPTLFRCTSNLYLTDIRWINFIQENFENLVLTQTSLEAVDALLCLSTVGIVGFYKRASYIATIFCNMNHISRSEISIENLIDILEVCVLNGVKELNPIIIEIIHRLKKSVHYKGNDIQRILYLMILNGCFKENEKYFAFIVKLLFDEFSNKLSEYDKNKFIHTVWSLIILYKDNVPNPFLKYLIKYLPSIKREIPLIKSELYELKDIQNFTDQKIKKGIWPKDILQGYENEFYLKFRKLIKQKNIDQYKKIITEIIQNIDDSKKKFCKSNVLFDYNIQIDVFNEQDRVAYLIYSKAHFDFEFSANPLFLIDERLLKNEGIDIIRIISDNWITLSSEEKKKIINA